MQRVYDRLCTLQDRTRKADGWSWIPGLDSLLAWLWFNTNVD